MVIYSDIKFVSRTGCFFDTKFKATVKKTTITGWIFKKEKVETVSIASKAVGFFIFSDTGEYCGDDIVALVRAHNLNCREDERLEY